MSVMGKGQMSARDRPSTTESDDLDELHRRWEEWLRLPYPASQHLPGSPPGQIGEVDLALLDGDAASVIHVFLHPGSLADEAALRRESREALEKVVPLLAGEARAYFSKLLDLIRAVDTARSADDGQAP
jgi:hypothetical protein